MTRAIHLLTLLAVIAVPVIGWFIDDWSGATTLLVYWFDSVAASVFITARILIHRRWTPRRGHFRYNAPSSDRSFRRSSFLSGYVVTSVAFSAAHGIFLAAIIAILNHQGERGLAEINWHSVKLGCAIVLAFIIVDFAVDLFELRRWSFRQIEQTAYLGLGRVVVIHLTLIIGFVGLGFTDAPTALFGSFVVLKSLFALSTALPQREPAAAPPWLSRIMNRVPTVHPGETFEDRWAEDQADEAARRDSNEQPWSAVRR